ncbi:VCBS repeat-containing protein [Sphaerisporangium sp. B11E5]|uniref:FG-GAP repeat domain-containing protein n=1 Tax=Sphaerisporangium sp. B11E5 TaxID=3153563 RepID=UPI00325CF45D
MRLLRPAARHAGAVLVCGLALTACGAVPPTGSPATAGPSGGSSPSGTVSPAHRWPDTLVTDPGVVSVAARGVPRGEGGTLPDDVNGDGYPDAVIISERADADVFLTVLYGSANGLNPERRTVVTPLNWVVWQGGTSWRYRRPDTADLDGDGFADIPILIGAQGDVPAVRVLWGGPGGPVAGGLSPALPVPDPGRTTYDWPATGDFDGDGRADLAFGQQGATSQADGGYAVLHGPFGRDGGWRDTVTRVLGNVSWVAADTIAPGRATGLVAHRGDDGEQTGGFHLPTLSGGQAHPFGPGNAVAFGDFDGDGLRDLAVGDDGGRNNEPGYETLGATHAVTLHYGRAPGVPVPIPVPGIRGKLTAADFDGDGRDDLALQTGDHVELRVNGLTETRDLGTFRCPRGTGLISRAVAVRAGDYDRDGRAELLVNCWANWTGQDPKRWWVWDPDGPGLAFDTTGFTS